MDIAHEPLSETHIKEFHRLLKANTSDARKEWFRVGGYKTLPNMVGGAEASPPSAVASDMNELLLEYGSNGSVDIYDVIDFHYRFEKIHPFQDGNGRVGRLIIFKECLRHGIVPFIVEDDHKMFYYRGLTEYPKVKEYLIDTCLSAQDSYKRLLDYFEIGC